MGSERIERNFKGHLIVAEHCHWFATTDVNGYRISTIGDYRPPHGGGERETVGFERFYETMVFPLSDRICGCGCDAPLVSSWCELEMEGYNEMTEARAGHERMVERWSQKLLPAPTEGAETREEAADV